MAIHRTYLVRMPSDAGKMLYIDILPTGPVGSPQAAIGNRRATWLGGGGAALAPCPVGWQVFPQPGALPVYGDGAFFEWRGRSIRVESPVSSAPLVIDGVSYSTTIPRLRLGWKLTVVAGTASECPALPAVQYSKSFAQLAGGMNADGTPLSPPVAPASGLSLFLNSTNLIDDPSYSGGAYPVIRLLNTPETQSLPGGAPGTGCYYVHLDLFDMKDEDRNPDGI